MPTKRKFVAIVVACLFLPGNVWAQGLLIPSAKLPATQPVSGLMPGQSGVIQYRGQVTVRRKAALFKAERLKAVPFPLDPGDQIMTGSASGVVVRLKDMSEIRLDPNSVFVIKAESLQNVSLFLSLGKLWAAVTHNGGRVFAVETPTAVAAVRGTKFSVALIDPSHMVAQVYQGSVEVQALKNGIPFGPQALVGIGQQIQAAGGRLSPVQIFMKPPVGGPPSGKTAEPSSKNTQTEEKTAEEGAAAAPQQKEAHEEAAKEGAPPAAPQESEEHKQLREAESQLSVNREISQQSGEAQQVSGEAHSAASPMSSEASAQASGAAFEQQATQNYLQAEDNIKQNMASMTPAAPEGESVGKPEEAPKTAAVGASGEAAAPGGEAAMGEPSAMPDMGANLGENANPFAGTSSGANAAPNMEGSPGQFPAPAMEGTAAPGAETAAGPAGATAEGPYIGAAAGPTAGGSLPPVQNNPSIDLSGTPCVAGNPQCTTIGGNTATACPGGVCNASSAGGNGPNSSILQAALLAAEQASQPSTSAPPSTSPPPSGGNLTTTQLALMAAQQAAQPQPIITTTPAVINAQPHRICVVYNAATKTYTSYPCY